MELAKIRSGICYNLKELYHHPASQFSSSVTVNERKCAFIALFSMRATYRICVSVLPGKIRGVSAGGFKLSRAGRETDIKKR